MASRFTPSNVPLKPNDTTSLLIRSGPGLLALALLSILLPILLLQFDAQQKTSAQYAVAAAVGLVMAYVASKLADSNGDRFFTSISNTPPLRVRVASSGGPATLWTRASPQLKRGFLISSLVRNRVRISDTWNSGRWWLNERFDTWLAVFICMLASAPFVLIALAAGWAYFNFGGPHFPQPWSDQILGWSALPVLLAISIGGAIGLMLAYYRALSVTSVWTLEGEEITDSLMAAHPGYSEAELRFSKTAK